METLKIRGLQDKEFEEHMDSYRRGDNLTLEQKRVIDSSDTWAVSLIEDLDKRELVVPVGDAFFYMDLGHSNEVQQKWFQKEKELLEWTLGRPPTTKELLADAFLHHNPERFRLAYTLNFPYKMCFNKPKYYANRSDVDVFLAEAEIVHPSRYPYFMQIWYNTDIVQTRANGNGRKN